MKKAYFVILVFILIACSDTGTNPRVDQTGFWPLKTGNTWVYRTTNISSGISYFDTMKIILNYSFTPVCGKVSLFINDSFYIVEDKNSCDYDISFEWYFYHRFDNERTYFYVTKPFSNGDDPVVLEYYKLPAIYGKDGLDSVNLSYNTQAGNFICSKYIFAPDSITHYQYITYVSQNTGLIARYTYLDEILWCKQELVSFSIK